MTDRTTPQTTPSIGRFAPSPTGPLHLGSLVAAVASYCASNEWLVRIEDVDEPRNMAGATESILATLDRMGFVWSKPEMRQRNRLPAYREALEFLKAKGLVYPCGCTRAEIADACLPAAGSGERPYSGTCRRGLPPGRQARTCRMRVEDTEVAFDDLIQGRVRQNLGRETGDFVLLRADGIFAYQLAVVVDDAAQGVNQVVRGADLLASTPRQIWLQRALGLPTPVYAHHPVALGSDGSKLSKQNLAQPVDEMAPEEAMRQALSFLGHRPPSGLDCAAQLAWARVNWDFGRVPPVPSLPLSHGDL